MTEEIRQLLAGKTCAIDILYAVIRNQETLLPPHEHGPSVAVRDGVVRSFKVVLNVTEGGEAGPMYHVVGLVGAPILSTEAVAAANDLSVKVGGELGIIFGETSDAKVTAEERRRKVDVLPLPVSRRRKGAETYARRWLP